MNPTLPQSENVSVRSISREVDLAWLAGILDGEGALSVGLTKHCENGLMYLDPKIRIYNTDIRMIQKVARIYSELNVVFFYNLNKKRADHYKDQVGICVTSQGSCIKILDAVTQYLGNKQQIAIAMRDVVAYVKGQPKVGNGTRNNYAGHVEFIELMRVFEAARTFHIDPSTSRRKAREVISW